MVGLGSSPEGAGSLPVRVVLACGSDHADGELAGPFGLGAQAHHLDDVQLDIPNEQLINSLAHSLVNRPSTLTGLVFL